MGSSGKTSAKSAKVRPASSRTDRDGRALEGGGGGSTDVALEPLEVSLEAIDVVLLAATPVRSDVRFAHAEQDVWVLVGARRLGRVAKRSVGRVRKHNPSAGFLLSKTIGKALASSRAVVAYLPTR
jgi:hypothetical protein